MGQAGLTITSSIQTGIDFLRDLDWLGRSGQRQWSGLVMVSTANAITLVFRQSRPRALLPRDSSVRPMAASHRLSNSRMDSQATRLTQIQRTRMTRTALYQ